MEKLSTCLWFKEQQAEEAATFYQSIFKDAKLGRTLRWGKDGHGPEGSIITIQITMHGHDFILLNGNPQYPFTEAVSLMVKCANQQELDTIWDGLLAGGGQTMECGWLKDKYGVAWQVMPEKMMEWVTNPATSERVMAQMMQMVKLDFAPLEAAAASQS